MPGPNDFMLADLRARYDEQASSNAFDRLYEDDEEFGHMFSVLHKRLNQHFTDINDRARTTHHYWADNSRDMIALIDTINEDLYELKRAGVEIELIPAYQEAIDRCAPWLSQSGGSTVPDDFEQIQLVKYEPAFRRPDTAVKLTKPTEAPAKLTMVGEGSYAHVYSYTDPDYGKKFAVKRAKRGISERDLHRFRQEFDYMKRLSFPYIVEVYKYDESRNEYRMEYCESTLRDHIAKRNDKMSFAARKRIALQFLYGMNYIHAHQLLHRDISLQNVILKVYDAGAVLVKLSDFGLVKDKDSDYTRTTTEMRGTIRDPQLENFKDYNVLNEIYSIGWVLNYIFTGSESLRPGKAEVADIVQKCVAHDLTRRYQSVRDVIADVETLGVTSSDAPA